MKKRIGFGKVLFLLLAFPGVQVFAAPADTQQGESKPVKPTSAVEFKVFDSANLGDEPFSCVNGYIVPCKGTEEACRCDSNTEIEA